jgi:hypothetical protein
LAKSSALGIGVGKSFVVAWNPCRFFDAGGSRRRLTRQERMTMNPLDRRTSPSFLTTLTRTIMWSAISLACAVVSAYALLFPAGGVQPRFEIDPDTDMRRGHDGVALSQGLCLRPTTPTVAT